MTKIKIAVPGPNEPGFLQRQKALLEYGAILAKFSEKPDPNGMDDLVGFILNFVEEPKDKKKAEEALWDASEEQFNEIITALTSSMEPPEVPNENGGQSETGT